MKGIGERDVGENERWREEGKDCGEYERLGDVKRVAYIHTYIHTYVHIYIYIHTYMHTYIHTYIRM